MNTNITNNDVLSNIFKFLSTKVESVHQFIKDYVIHFICPFFTITNYHTIAKDLNNRFFKYSWLALNLIYFFSTVCHAIYKLYKNINK